MPRYRFGLDDQLVADVRGLIQAVLDGRAVLQEAWVHRDGKGPDFLRTELRLVLAEPSAKREDA